jgi:hypothetical protein
VGEPQPVCSSQRGRRELIGAAVRNSVTACSAEDLNVRHSLALPMLLAVVGCGYSELSGDFRYSCHGGAYGVDGPSCELYLTEHYLLRYGEGSGDRVVLAWTSAKGEGSSGLLQDLGGDFVRRVGLNEQLLTVQTGDGRIFVAPAQDEHFPDIAGPLTQTEFNAQYPGAPSWKLVQ